MAEFEIKEQIAGVPEQIFQFLTDPCNAPRISPNIQSLEQITSGPIGMGTRFRETRIMNGKPAQAELEIVEYAPPRAYAMRNTTDGIETVYRYTLTRAGSATEVQLAATVNAGGLKKLMAPIVLNILKKEDGDHLKRLKKLLESQ
jgi:carbon monoxide dehydrogenase subunit G